MKTILLTLFLFLCLKGWGQTITKRDTIWVNDKPFIVYTTTDPTPPATNPILRHNTFSFNALKELVDLWHEYYQWCWNDSTLTRVHNPHGEYCVVDWECLIASHWQMIYLHKDPNDLKQFMEWLENKLP